jgi:hypothetical protein
MTSNRESFATSESFLNGIELVREAFESRAVFPTEDKLEPVEFPDSGLGWHFRLRM